MRKKILIIEDSSFFRVTLKNLLKNDYDISEADCGASGIQKYYDEQPDLVLLDILMPDGSFEGINVLKKIHKHNPKTIVMMVTALGQDKVIQKCKEAGATDYIVKPFKPRTVIEKVKQYLS